MNRSDMAREPINLVIDLSVPDNKRRLLTAIAPLSGVYDVALKPRRATRTLAQNAYYHGVIVKCLMDFLHDQGEMVDHDETHTLLKAKFLTREVLDRRTGEPIGAGLRSTTKLDVAEFSDYIERCIAWLADVFGILVPDPPRQEAVHA